MTPDRLTQASNRAGSQMEQVLSGDEGSHQGEIPPPSYERMGLAPGIKAPKSPSAHPSARCPSSQPALHMPSSSTMTSPSHSLQTFTLFPRLPAELRIQIWTIALTLPTVWTATLTAPLAVHEGGPVPPSHRTIKLTCISSFTPPPHLTSLTNRESRQTMQHIYRAPLRGPMLDSSPSKTGWWIYLETATIIFPDPADALAVLDRFGSGEIGRFRHVVLAWQGWRTHPRVALRLANSCPGLRSVVVQRMEEEGGMEGGKEAVAVSSTGTISRSWLRGLGMGMGQAKVLEVDRERAGFYAVLAARGEGGREGKGGEEGEDYDGRTYRRSILRYFEDSGASPRLYVLAPGEVRRRGRVE